jgi:hypothetical protein
MVMKKTYSTPKLIEHGTVEEITQGSLLIWFPPHPRGCCGKKPIPDGS